jgi:hypothetical protein
MDRSGSGWSDPLYTVSTAGWEPPVETRQTDDGVEYVGVTADAVSAWETPAKAYGMHFEVAARVRGRDASVLMRIFDQVRKQPLEPMSSRSMLIESRGRADMHGQGNSVLGRIHGMGFGIRAASATPGTTGTATPIPAGVRLLPFCIVAKVPICNEPQLDAVYDDLRRLGIGSGRFERWQSTTTIFVYDVDKSVGYLVNTPGKIKGANPNVKIVLPCADSWVAWRRGTIRPNRSGLAMICGRRTAAAPTITRSFARPKRRAPRACPR